jgi:hypothetical protein
MRGKLLVAAVVGLPLGSASAVAATQPKLLAGPYGSSSSFEVRPATLILSPDGSAILGRLPNWVGRPGGRRYIGPDRGSLNWQWWTPKQAEQAGYGRRIGAYAYGILWNNDCKPDCATGTYYASDAELTAWRVRDGHYTREGLQYTNPRGLAWYSVVKLGRDGRGHYRWRYLSSGRYFTGCRCIGTG